MGGQWPASQCHLAGRCGCGGIAAFLCPVEAGEVGAETNSERKREQARRAAPGSHWTAVV